MEKALNWLSLNKLGSYSMLQDLGKISLGPEISNTDVGFVCLEGSLTNRPDAEKDSPEMQEVKGYRCPVGHFCLAGVTLEEKCPAGTYREIDRGQSVADCAFCQTGKYCEEGTNSS